ncbi:MAG: class I SAM-dependent methyltransferase [Candidatus Aminicenantes bacterium]|nr:MAG: class I SAM-dependent methyltransferase [Candidatus Aminicenantes bacterium]
MERHVCPWWLGYFLASPLRRCSQDPGKILRPYIKEGMKVMDVGCAMGFFSLPLARMVGSTGQVVCIDLQEKMIASLKKRAAKAGLSPRIETRVCSEKSLEIDDIPGEIDFALVFAVVHEVPDSEALFSQVHLAMKPAGKLLLGEPRGRVSESDFRKTIATARQCGFEVMDHPQIKRSRAVFLSKKLQ